MKKLIPIALTLLLMISCGMSDKECLTKRAEMKIELSQKKLEAIKSKASRDIAILSAGGSVSERQRNKAHAPNPLEQEYKEKFEALGCECTWE